MKKILLGIALAILAFGVKAQDNSGVLTGDARDACAVILCLAGGTNISECRPPLNHYFSIIGRTPHSTITKRRNFLNLCPTGSIDNVNNAQMEDLRRVISRLQNDCSTEILNHTLVNAGEIDGTPVYSIIQHLPDQCNALYNHAFRNSDTKAPVNTCDSNERYTREGWDTGTQVFYYYGFGTPRPHLIPPEAGRADRREISINYNCWKQQ